MTVDEEYCRSHLLERSGAYAVVSVSDTGVGMDETTRRQIFEPFFTTKEVGKGTGLGLSIVYGIIKQHNGTIDVVSKPGRGTTFRVLLPLTAEMDRPGTQTAEKQALGGTETILLAEDESDVRTMMRIVLNDAGYRVIEAVDGEDGLKRFSEDPQGIDLLLTDVIMPRKNGKDLAAAVHMSRPDVKVLFMSGYTADIVQKKGILDEDARFLSKPILPEQLLRAVRDSLDGPR
jgi:CheY-like chemotaxis protein